MDKKEVKLEIQMDEATAQGVYANLAGVSHSETEFVFDFIFLQPNQPKAKLRSRVISSPVHTKRFAKALLANIERYEASFGVIPDSPLNVTEGHS